MLDSMDFRLCVRRNLRVTIFDSPRDCKCLLAEVDVYGDHALSCKPDGGVVGRHDAICRVIHRLIREALYDCATELTYDLPGAGKKTYRADLVVVMPIPGVTTRKALLDVTVINPTAKYLAKAASKDPEVAMNAGIDSKHYKIDVEKINVLGFDFLPLSFEATGGFDANTENACLFFLGEKAKFQNREFAEVSAEFWHSLSIVIQRWTAHMIRNRLYEATTQV